MNKRTVCLTEEQYENIIKTMREGTECKNTKILPNNRVATALVTEANLGIRISDILNLTPDYAEKIGADYYAKDAKQSADIAKAVIA